MGRMQWIARSARCSVLPEQDYLIHLAHQRKARKALLLGASFEYQAFILAKIGLPRWFDGKIWCVK